MGALIDVPDLDATTIGGGGGGGVGGVGGALGGGVGVGGGGGGEVLVDLPRLGPMSSFWASRTNHKP